MFTSKRFTVLLTVLMASALALAGCGGSDDGGSDDGAKTDNAPGEASGPQGIFASTCGSCHTLADAGTTGSVGPKLDGKAYDAEFVATIIEKGRGTMPGGLLDGAELDSVADYVAEASK
ncbi:MAG: cytochrome c [Gaiellales bacterium]